MNYTTELSSHELYTIALSTVMNYIHGTKYSHELYTTAISSHELYTWH